MGIGRGGKEIKFGALGLAGGAQGDAAGLKKGGFAVAWSNFSDPFSGAMKDGVLTGIVARLADKNGKTKGKVFEVNRTAEDQQVEPEVAANDKGGFVVAWQNIRLNGDGNEAEAQVFKANGKRVGKELRLSTTSEDEQSRPELAPAGKGGVFAVWEDERDSVPGLLEGDLYVREVTHRGKLKREVKVVDDNVITPAFERLKDGKFALVYDDIAQIVVRVLNKKLQTVAEHEMGELVDAPQVVALKNGGFVVLWETQAAVAANGNAQWDATIVGQRFDKNGKAVGKLIAIPKNGDGDEADFDAAAFGKGFAVAWMDEDKDGFGIRARAFDARGKADGAEVKVNKVQDGDQGDPFIAEGKGGKLLIGWTDLSGKSGRAPSEIVGRVFKASGTKKKKQIDGDDDDAATQVSSSADEVLRATKAADLFVFGPESGTDVIRRFDPDEDRIAVSGARFRDLDVDDAKAGVRIAFGDAQITLRGVDADELGRDDFVFG